MWRRVAKFLKLWVTLHPNISKTVNRTKKVTRANIPGPSAVSSAQTRCKPKGQGCSALAASVPQQKKTLKWDFLGKMTLFRKNFEILFRKFSWPYRFTFCVQISWKSFAGKWVKRCVVLERNKEVAKYVFFRCHAAPVQQRAPKVCRGACNVILRLRVKFRPNRFWFAGVIPEKVILYEYSIMPSAYNN